MKTFLGVSLLSTLFFLGFAAMAQVIPAPVASPIAVAPVATGLIAWLQLNGTMLFGVLFGISEALALIPSIKSNSIFTLVYNALKALAPKQ